jgi:hypothetical protein
MLNDYSGLWTMSEIREKNALHGEIKSLRNTIPQLVDALKLTSGVDISSWCHHIDKKLMPRLTPDFPLVVSICGGGSSGKSSLFNALLQENISPTGGTAGINRRILIAGNSKRFPDDRSFSKRFETFGFRSQRLTEKHELITPGEPLFVRSPNIPPDLVLLDTPDFDTGAGGIYTNRDMARQALEVSDVFIYIFTNANYNNLDNTDFISEMFTGIGRRKCFLVYRIYSSYEDRDISAHAHTVARNIYGEDADRFVLGVYRADEDNRVAADEKFMEIRPFQKNEKPLTSALTALNVEQFRVELLSSILQDVLQQAEQVVAWAKRSTQELLLYQDALQTWQSHCVHEALQHFPMEIILKRFTEIWLATDPKHIRWMRKAGDIIELPFKAIVGTVKWVKGKPSTKKQDRSAIQQFSGKLEEDLLTAVNNLWRKAVNPEVSVTINKFDPVAQRMVDTYHGIESHYASRSKENPHRMDAASGETLEFFIQTHAAAEEAQRRIRSRDWQDVLKSIMDRKDAIVSISEKMDTELAAIVEQIRSRMNFFAGLRQTFSALLNVLPATAAVSYILTTGDPIGAAGIKVKLTGLFGLKDLYALVAIPATTGLKKADQKQLEELLSPIAKTWLENRLNTIRRLFEEEITGELITAAAEAQKISESLTQRATENILTSRKLSEEI